MYEGELSLLPVGVTHCLTAFVAVNSTIGTIYLTAVEMIRGRKVVSKFHDGTYLQRLVGCSRPELCRALCSPSSHHLVSAADQRPNQRAAMSSRIGPACSSRSLVRSSLYLPYYAFDSNWKLERQMVLGTSTAQMIKSMPIVALHRLLLFPDCL
jgi:hypothetical protein